MCSFTTRQGSSPDTTAEESTSFSNYFHVPRGNFDLIARLQSPWYAFFYNRRRNSGILPRGKRLLKKLIRGEETVAGITD